MWHIDKVWKEKLQELVSSTEVQADVYKMLRTVLEQMDESLCTEYLQITLTRLESSNATMSFGKYFREQWSSEVEHWSYCHRKGFGINSNMFVEAFHRVLKYSYLRGKANRRLDVCIVGLIKYNRDKIFQRLTKLTKGKNTQKVLLHIALYC